MAVPGLSRLAILTNPNARNHGPLLQAAKTTAAKAAVTLVPVAAGTLQEIERAFEMMTNDGVRATVFLPDPFLLLSRQRIADLAIRNRLPSIFAHRDYVEVGGLMSYGESFGDFGCPAASILNREVFLDFDTDPPPQTQDVSPRLLELRLDERRLWVVGNRLLAVVVDVDGACQVSLVVACAIAQSRPDAPVVAETEALGARDLFGKREIENCHWALCRRLGGGARHYRKEGDQNGAHDANYCWHLPVLLNEISCDELGRNKRNTCDT